MSYVNKNNYILIQGFMIKDLKLKGNELLIYAIIYGFSQLEGQVFSGSLQYLADWTNSTRRGIIKNLKSLLDKGYIQKEIKTINGVKKTTYWVVNKVHFNSEQSSQGYATEFTGVGNKVHRGSEQSSLGGSEQSSPNNIILNKLNNNLNNKINNNLEEKEKIKKEKDISEIIDFLNQTIGTNYKTTTKKTIDLINARFKDGFNLEDFKKVISKKAKDWLGTEYEKYLRPDTLFGNKFESYLNQKEREFTTGDFAKVMNWEEFL